MVNHLEVKLGKAAAKPDDGRRLKLAKYLLSTLPAPPDNCDYSYGLTAWGMMLNARLSCCTISGIGHAIQGWSAAGGTEITVPDEAIEQKYEDWCGYRPGNPATDQGGVEVDVLDDWRKSKFWSHLLLAYADPDPTNLAHVKQAIYLFGGLYIGLQLPISAQGHQTWDVGTGPSGVPGSWGGHAVWVVGYRTNADGTLTFTCVSWGELYELTQAFWLYNDPTIVDYGDGQSGPIGPYVDETHALVSPVFLNLKTGTTPVGFDLPTMLADVKKVAA